MDSIRVIKRILDHCQIMIDNRRNPTADELKDFARDLDRQLASMVRDAGGDGSFLIECNESAIDLAFQYDRDKADEVLTRWNSENGTLIDGYFN